MKMTVLCDNMAGENLLSEWGLSLYIEYGDKKLLLDTGASPLFLENAKRLGIDLSQIDAAVLSHAHYDHSDGFPAFFECNSRAPLYLQAGCGENCYSMREEGMRYIGIGRGILTDYKERLKFTHGKKEIFPGVFLIPHKRPLSERGEHSGQFIRMKERCLPDDYLHEQSLVFLTDRGLVVFNSCSHGGVMQILNEVSEAFDGERIYAMIGGFHLYRSSKEEILALAKKLKSSGVTKVITGHCTGEEGFALLKTILGEQVEQMYSGLTAGF